MPGKRGSSFLIGCNRDGKHNPRDDEAGTVSNESDESRSAQRQHQQVQINGFSESK